MSSPSPSSPPTFPGRLAVLQRVLPAYRVPFFDTLAAACQGGLSLAAGRPHAGGIHRYRRAARGRPLCSCSQPALWQPRVTRLPVLAGRPAALAGGLAA